MEGFALLAWLLAVPQVIVGNGTLGEVTLARSVPAEEDSNCAALMADIWAATGYDQPMERTGAQLENGDGCTGPFDPGKKEARDE